MRLIFNLAAVAVLLAPQQSASAQDARNAEGAVAAALLRLKAEIGTGSSVVVRQSDEAVLPQRASEKAAAQAGMAWVSRSAAVVADHVFEVLKSDIHDTSATLTIQANGRATARRGYFATTVVTLVREGHGWRVKETRYGAVEQTMRP